MYHKEFPASQSPAIRSSYQNVALILPSSSRRQSQFLCHCESGHIDDSDGEHLAFAQQMPATFISDARRQEPRDNPVASQLSATNPEGCDRAAVLSDNYKQYEHCRLSRLIRAWVID